MRPTLKGAAAAALFAPALALAADAPGRVTFDVERIYRDGWSAERMLDVEVCGNAGEAIGEVEDIIVGPGGEIRKIMVEVGGVAEIGDQHIGVPWKDVAIGPDMAYVQVPLEEVRSGTYSLFGKRPAPQGEDVPARRDAWRVDELLGDFASLEDVEHYGIVDDVIFDRAGQAIAVIVDRTRGAWGGHGAHAYPYFGYYPGAYAYPLPYRSDGLVALEPFDYAKLAAETQASVR